METQTKTNTGKTKTVAIVGILAVAMASMGWYAKSNWFKEAPKAVCSLSQTSVYDKYKFAVPIIFTEYVYDVSIKGSAPVSFTLTEEGGWSLYNEYTSPITVSGTAFFVSKTGQLITNKHVVEPWSYSEESSSLSSSLAYFVKADIAPSDIKSYLKNNWDSRYEAYEGDGEDAEEEEAVATVTTDTTVAPATDGEEMTSDLVVQAQSANETATPPADEVAYVATSDIKITPKRVRIYIAMHGTEITPSSIIPCKVQNISPDNAIDVALIQTKDKKLPKQVKDFIHLDSASTADQNIKPGTKAYMLGYPMGTTLASTSKGIRVQIYEGQVNKESDGTSLQYNITSTHGASGSPVINDCGKLIAVNYAGFDVAQGFNFGIVAKHAVNLFEDQ